MVIFMTFLQYHSHLGLLLSILDNSPVVKEGEDITITCTPSVPTVQVVWDTPIASFSNETLVSYSEPLRHNITIHSANLNHEGNYTCRVFGDTDRMGAAATAYVHVRESESIEVNVHSRVTFLYTYFCNRMF